MSAAVTALIVCLGFALLAAGLLWLLALKLADDKTHLTERLGFMKQAVDAEYDRATREGRAQVHRWAVDVNYNIFNGSHPWQGTQYARTVAALQDAEHQFAPRRFASGGVVTNGTGDDSVPVMIAPGEEYVRLNKEER